MNRRPILRRTPLARAPMKPWIRADDDKVTPELHAYVMERDRECIAFKHDPAHVCKTRFGKVHAPDDRKLLTLDHVHHAATAGKRAMSDKWHLVAACGDANNEGWCSAHRAEERDYLLKMEGPQP